MPITISDVAFYSSNHIGSDGIGSLGGSISGSTPLTSQTVEAQPTIITGCYISQVYGNPVGTGTLSYNPTTQVLSWKPNGSAYTYTSVPIAANGQYEVGEVATGILIVNVTYSSLPTTYKVESITVGNPIGTVFGQVTTTMALLGDVQYRCLYFRNNHASLSATDLRLYIHSPAPLPQTIEIGVDPAGVGDGLTTGVAQTIATANSAPTGVTFSSPMVAANGISLGTLAPNNTIALWQKRTVPPMSYGNLVIAQFTLGVALVG